MSDQPQYPTYPDYQQQQYQQPQYPPAAQPPKKGGMGKWIALGGCGCLFFLAVIAGIVFFVFQMTAAPMKAVNDHLASLRSDNVEKAYNDCSSGFKAETNLTEFQAFVKGYPFFATAKEFSSFNRETKNGVTTLDGNVETTDGAKHPVEYRVIKEGDTYKVHYINVKEAASATPVQPDTPQPEEPPAAGTSAPEIFDININKSQSGATITVVVAFQVQSFHNGREGDNYTIHLVQDLETTGPDGNRMSDLSMDNIKTLSESGAQEYTSANFSNTLNIPSSYPSGTYNLRLRVRDVIGGGVTEETASFDFP